MYIFRTVSLPKTVEALQMRALAGTFSTQQHTHARTPTGTRARIRTRARTHKCDLSELCRSVHV